jgi:hypothetical protein
MAGAREFVLHDGEDGAKTKELHEFLDGFEWDGDNGGITIWLDPRVGDTIVLNEDGSILVRRKPCG